MHIARRASGVLLHVASLPSEWGVGDLGPWAHRFVDLLSESSQSHWQILPLNPTSTECGNSPYSTRSAFAANTLLVSPQKLVEQGLLAADAAVPPRRLHTQRADYDAATSLKRALLDVAHHTFRERFEEHRHAYEEFCSENTWWLDDYALYSALREASRTPWYLWPAHLKNREAEALAQKADGLRKLVEQHKFAQYVFHTQWEALRRHAHRAGVTIIGDLPFYVDYDSADVWSHPEIFRLDENKRPLYVGGVPPDYFSATGQLWGNPVYDWEKLEAKQFEWWVQRVERSLTLYDAVRIDHFRGLVAYWEVPAGSKTAVNGRWATTPTEGFFKTLAKHFPGLPFIAEDLGVITPDVREAMQKYHIPGMRVLLFAFDGSPENPHLPHNHAEGSVAYTGTHDTNTAKGWFKEEATRKQKQALYSYVGRRVSEDEASWQLIRLTLGSVAKLAVVPLQDILSLGSEARMNHPGRPKNNWEWRATPKQLGGKPFAELRELTQTYARQ